MKTELTAEQARELLDYDPSTGGLVWRKSPCNSIPAGSRAGSPNNHGYLLVSVMRRTYHVHRLIWLLSHGVWPEGQVDHKNGNRLDNRLCNLRVASRNQNCANSKLRKDSFSGVKGVLWSKAESRWIARLDYKGRRVLRRRFTTKEEAEACVREARLRFHGEFAHHG
jgi:hypothetical protein